MWGKTVFERRNGVLVKYVVGRGRPRRSTPRIYDCGFRKFWPLISGNSGRLVKAIVSVLSGRSRCSRRKYLQSLRYALADDL